MAEWPGKKLIQKSHLFFTFKQKYPNMPDQIVSHCITTAGGDEKATEVLLESPEYSKYKPKPNNVLLVERGSEDTNAAPFKASCSITRHVPPGLPKSGFLPPLTPSFGFGTPSVVNNIFTPIRNPQQVQDLELHDRIKHQLRNKRNLEVELNKYRKKHAELEMQIAKLKTSLAVCRASDKIEKLNLDVTALRKDCAMLNAEYDGMLIKSTAEVRITASNGTEAISWGTEAWHCEMCTFRNHHLLNQCETCCMPRINVGINAV